MSAIEKLGIVLLFLCAWHQLHLWFLDKRIDLANQRIDLLRKRVAILEDTLAQHGIYSKGSSCGDR